MKEGKNISLLKWNSKGIVENSILVNQKFYNLQNENSNF
jgi:hypothetical protein